MLYVELKDRHGRLSDAQRRWLAALERAGQDVYVWRPADWASGTIEATLKRLALPRRCGLCGAEMVGGLCLAHGGLDAADGLYSASQGDRDGLAASGRG